jgi:hypothetical protein
MVDSVDEGSSDLSQSMKCMSDMSVNKINVLFVGAKKKHPNTSIDTKAVNINATAQEWCHTLANMH